MTINEIIAELQKLVEHHGDDVLRTGLDTLGPVPLAVKAYRSAYDPERMIVSFIVGANTALVVSTDSPK